MTAIKTETTILSDPDLDPNLSKGTDILYGGPDSGDASASQDGVVDGLDFVAWRDGLADGDDTGGGSLLWYDGFNLEDNAPTDTGDSLLWYDGFVLTEDGSLSPSKTLGLYNLINGTRGFDDIGGTDSNDLINAYTGNDLVSGRGGDDIIHGGAGADYLWGDYSDLEGMGLNELPNFGNPGDDVLYGEGGNDILEGGPGDDLLYGGTGDDMLLGGLGANQMWGGDGADQFYTIAEMPYDGIVDTSPDWVHDFAPEDSVQGTAFAVIGTDTLVFDDAYHVLFVLENYDADTDGLTLLG